MRESYIVTKLAKDRFAVEHVQTDTIAVFYDEDHAAQYAAAEDGEAQVRASEAAIAEMRKTPITNGANGVHHDNGANDTGRYTQAQYAVLSALKRHAVNGVATLSNGDISVKSGVSKTSVSTHLRALAAKNAIDERCGGVYRIL